MRAWRVRHERRNRCGRARGPSDRRRSDVRCAIARVAPHSDEEVGSQSSRALIEEEARRSVAVLVLEPSLPGGGVKTARKGVGEFTIEAHGLSAHAGIEPEKGVNAIVELAHHVLALQALQDPSRGLTITAGRIEGGTRTNVVPAYSRVELDVRVSTMVDAGAIERALYALTPHVPGARLRVSGGINRPPLERSAHVVRLYESARSVAAALGRDLARRRDGRRSDGNFTAALGVPTLDGLGPLGGGAHAIDEHVELDHLAWRAALIGGLLMTALRSRWHLEARLAQGVGPPSQPSAPDP